MRASPRPNSSTPWPLNPSTGRASSPQTLYKPKFATEPTPSLHEWAYEVLKEAGQPLHVKAIAARVTVLAGRLVTSRQIVHALSHHRRDHGDASPYRSIARGVYGLKEHT
jgi:hypothetical protein